MDVDRARRLYEATRQLPFGEVPDGFEGPPPVGYDGVERLSLLTVAGGLRSTAYFMHLPARTLAALRSITIDFGLFPYACADSRFMYTFEWPDLPVQAVRAFIEEKLRNRDPALFVCSSAEVRSAVKAFAGSDGPSVFLDYPQCCASADRTMKGKVDRWFLQQILARHGCEPRRIVAAMRSDQGFEVPDDIGELIRVPNVPATRRTYPYVLHIACGECLSSRESETARLNRQYDQFLQLVAPDLHQGIREETERLSVG